jgi:hypothetical protein
MHDDPVLTSVSRTCPAFIGGSRPTGRTGTDGGSLLDASSVTEGTALESHTSTERLEVHHRHEVSKAARTLRRNLAVQKTPSGFLSP